MSVESKAISWGKVKENWVESARNNEPCHKFANEMGKVFTFCNITPKMSVAKILMDFPHYTHFHEFYHE